MDDTERTHHDDRRAADRRKLVRYIPDFSAGTVFQTVGLLVMAGTAYGTYTADRAAQKAEMEAVKRENAAQQAFILRAVDDLKLESRETKALVSTAQQDIAAVKAQLNTMQKENR